MQLVVSLPDPCKCVCLRARVADEVPRVSGSAHGCWTFKSCLCKVTAGTVRHCANVLSVYLDKLGVGPFACRYVVRATIKSAVSALNI